MRGCRTHWITIIRRTPVEFVYRDMFDLCSGEGYVLFSLSISGVINWEQCQVCECGRIHFTESENLQQQDLK